jgi:DNA polymerase III subunit delta
MTAIKASDVDRFIARPDAAQPIVLIYGPDAGLVRERVDALVRASVDDPNDPFALARIEGEELSANPARLIEEALTVPLFGGRHDAAVAVHRLEAAGGEAGQRQSSQDAGQTGGFKPPH